MSTLFNPDSVSEAAGQVSLSFDSTGVPQGLGRIAAMHVRGEKVEALREVQALLAQAPDCIDAHCIRSRISMELEDYPVAAHGWERFHSLAKGSPETRRSMAQCYQQIGRWKEAADLFRELLANDAEDGEALMGLGLCELQLQQPEDSAANLAKYLETHPANPAARFGLAVAYQLLLESDEAIRIYEGLRTEGHYQAETLGNLIMIFRQQKDAARLAEAGALLLECDPDSVIGLQGAAFAAFLREDHEAAATWCERTVEVEGNRYEHWMNLALCRRKLGQTEGALQAYEEAVQRYPELTEAHVQIVSVLVETGRDEDAARMARRGIDNCPGAEDLYQMLGEIEERGGRDAQAEAVYEKLLEQRPESTEAWFRLGNARFAQREYENAQKAYETCLLLKSDWPEAQLNLALAYHEDNELPSAQKLLDKVLIGRPDWEPALRVAAVVALKMGLQHLALQYHERLIEIGAADPEVYFNAALLAEQLANPKTAVDYYRKSLELRPDFVEALVSLGSTLESLGKSKEARSHWGRAMELQPSLAREYFRVPA
jgi:tetratricopeptide (TPR) repeat protein